MKMIKKLALASMLAAVLGFFLTSCGTTRGTVQGHSAATGESVPSNSPDEK